MTSGASKARFRRATFTCLRIPVSTRQSLAWFAATKLRPMRSAAPPTVRMGAPGNARSSKSTPVACVLLLTNTSGVAVLTGFVMLVLFLLVGRTARALGPFVDESGRLLRDCVAYLM